MKTVFVGQFEGHALGHGANVSVDALRPDGRRTFSEQRNEWRAAGAAQGADRGEEDDPSPRHPRGLPGLFPRGGRLLAIIGWRLAAAR
jgi:hypothetical protein